MLPDCCFPSTHPETAEILYCRYNACNIDGRAGLNYQGKPCPTWGELTSHTDDPALAASRRKVVESWRHVAELFPAQSTKTTLDTRLDLALTRWAVAFHVAQELAPCSGPLIGPFLAGWFCRDMGMACLDLPTLGTFASSWRSGWTECDGWLNREK